MPLVPASVGNPYPTVGAVMNVARARVGDMVNDAAGDLLTDDAPYAQTYLSSAWEWLQTQCDTNGIETFEKEITLFGIPARANNDMANRASISWQGCSDGLNEYSGPVLPQDMIAPKSLWRRRTVVANTDGTPAVNTGTFCQMYAANGALPRYFDCSAYELSGDVVYFYGDTQAQDFQLRYSAYLPPLDITQPNSLVPIMRCMNALGARVAFEFDSARAGAGAPALQALADAEFASMKARSGRRKGRAQISRQPYSARFSGMARAWPVI